MDLEKINPNPQLSLFEENNTLIQTVLNESLKGMLSALRSGEVKFRVQDLLILKTLNDSLNPKSGQRNIKFIGIDSWNKIKAPDDNE